MCLISPEELQDVLIEASAVPLRPEERNQIAEMVESGFQAWREFHDRHAGRQVEIRDQYPGLASWEDLKLFLQEHGEAKKLDGFTASRFRIVEGAVMAHDDPVEVVRLHEGFSYLLGDGDGAPVTGPNGEKVNRLGLNVATVTELLRKFAFPEIPTGAAHLRWPAEIAMDAVSKDKSFAVLALLRQTFRAYQRTGWLEQSNALSCYLIGHDGNAKLIQGQEKRTLLRTLAKSVVRLKPDVDTTLLNCLGEVETRLCADLRRPTEAELREGIRHSVAPIFAAILTA